MMIRLRTSSTADSCRRYSPDETRRHCTLERHARHTPFPLARPVADLTGGVAQRTGDLPRVFASPPVPQAGPVAHAHGPFTAVNRTTMAGVPSKRAKSTVWAEIGPPAFSVAIASRHSCRAE